MTEKRDPTEALGRLGMAARKAAAAVRAFDEAYLIATWYRNEPRKEEPDATKD